VSWFDGVKSQLGPAFAPAHRSAIPH